MTFFLYSEELTDTDMDNYDLSHLAEIAESITLIPLSDSE